MVHVHIIEVRELRATDPDGSADPVVVVEVNFGDGKKQKAVTRVVQNDRNAVFDETFKVRLSEERSDELITSALGTKIAHACTSIPDAPPP